MPIVAPVKNTYNLMLTHEEEPKVLLRIFRWILNLAFALFTKREVEGLEHLPPRGPYIIAANHLDRLDPVLIFGLLGSENVTGWAAAKYQRHPLFAPIVHMSSGIFIRRGEVDREAIDAAVAWLRQGNVFGMAPEGTRSKTGALIKAKTGVAYLADQAEVPIVTVAITGTELIMHNLRRLRRPRVTVRVGAIIRLPRIQASERSADLRRHTDEIMCRIAAMLPPEYRGFYADHPRLKAILGETDIPQIYSPAD